MKLPSDISEKILDICGIPGLGCSTEARYRQRLGIIRKDMRRLAADFAASKPSEAYYRDAYFLYNFPMNLMKTAFVINTIGSRYPGLLDGKKRLRILDIGCGDGAGIYGCYYALRNIPGVREFIFKGIDSTPQMLRRAQILARWLGLRDPRMKVRFLKRRIDFADLLAIKGKYDVVMCINSLAELIQEEEMPVRVITSVLRCLVDGGVFLIIEPALKKFSQRLMRLRDVLTTHKNPQVLLPCLYDNPCALLTVEDRNEWCHQSISWSPPDFLKIINKGINREIDVLKFSYLVVTRSKERLKRPCGYAVTSHLLKEKGKQRCFICTPEGRVELVRLDRSKNANNAGFDRIDKGVIVKLTGIVQKKEDYWQVTEESAVQVLK
jgi:SAM-dependent methyltransferase